jgi:hypothetical protein
MTWKNRAGHRVWVEVTSRGEFLRCDGCRTRQLITGVQPSRFTAQQHADKCNR